MDNTKHRRLQELDRSDFEISKGEPDIRGWDVRNDAGLKIGEVEELIVDAQQKKVRYVVVDLDDKDLKLPDRKVLIPIGLAELHKEDDDVLLPSVTVDQLGALPAYDKDNLDDELEQKICTALGRTEATTDNLVEAGGPTTPEKELAQTKETTAETTNKTVKKDTGTTTPANKEQPAFGTTEYYGNFYQHAFFNDYNLYKNRQQERTQERTEKDSEYERGLRLWELRNEGDALAGEASGRQNKNREISDEERRERIQTRRKEYEASRSKKKSSIIQRINDEGLQEA